MADPFENIRLSIEGPIATLALCRPPSRNAMNEAMGLEVERAVEVVNADQSLRALIVRGEGKAFAAGGDLRFIEQRRVDEGEANRGAMLRFYRLWLSIRRVRVPTIAAMHGFAMGAGACFAMACDLRVAAVGTKIGLNFVRLGLHPGMGATALLPRLVGPARAAALLLTGRTIDAEEALRIGLVLAVVPEAELVGAARALADEIAAAAPLAVARTVATLRRAFDAELDVALEAESRAQALDYATEDLTEGVAAAFEKRVPRFHGK